MQRSSFRVFWRGKHRIKWSSVAGVQRPELPFLVVFSEKSFPKLVNADHDGAGWGHFDQPGQKALWKHNRKEALARGWEWADVWRYLQSLPANRAAMPSCVTILYITLMVELESWPDTGNKEQTANVTAHQIHRQFKWVLSWLHFFACCSPSSTCLLVLTTSNGSVTIDAIWKKRRNVYSFHYITF